MLQGTGLGKLPCAVGMGLDRLPCAVRDGASPTLLLQETSKACRIVAWLHPTDPTNTAVGCWWSGGDSAF